MQDIKKNIELPRASRAPLKKIQRSRYLIPVTVVILALLLLVGFVSYAVSVVKTPNSEVPTAKNFVIRSGDGASDVAEGLKSSELIKNRFIFVLYLNYKGIAGRVQAGEYQIAQNLNMIDLAQKITLGKTASTKITIPEGWTNRKIGQYLEERGLISGADFMASANFKKARDKYDFLKNLEEGDSLEGYLYPDTYQLSRQPTADEIITKMLDNFDKKMTAADWSKVQQSGMSFQEVITLSSVVEREVSKPEDRKLVASVFLNRLNIDMPLESCATIQYILNSNKTIFSYAETRTPSDYNTYINAGLPKGPIGNPSIDSIRAVLYPEKSNYYYFLSADGVTYFSKTLDEHNAKKFQYLR